MRKSVHDRCFEIKCCLDTALIYVSRIETLDGTRNPFNSQAANAALHDYLKRALAEADKLTAHFGSQLRRQGGRK
jgi:hypothetical protein